MAKVNYESIIKRHNYKLGEEVGNYNTYKMIIENYLEYVVMEINKAISKGYDWDVVSEMLWFKLSEDDYKALSEAYASV